MKLNDKVWTKANTNLPYVALSIWWVLWKAINNFILKGVAIDLKNIVVIIPNMYPYDSDINFHGCSL